jgi:hypothetical protein
MFRRIAVAGLAACAISSTSAFAFAGPGAPVHAGGNLIILVADNPCKGMKGDERKRCLAEQRADARKKKEHQESAGGRGGPGNGSD